MISVEDVCRTLVALDRIDHEAWAIEGELAAEPTAIGADAAALVAHEAEAARLEIELKAVRAVLATAEDKLAGIERRRTRAKRRLPEMLTGDSIAATEREIASLNEQAGDQEEIALIAMDSSEELGGALSAEQTAITDGKEALASRTTDWTTRKALIEARRAKLQTDREPIVGGLRGDIARRYAIGWNMPYYKPPSGLTSALDIMCTTCRTTLSPKWVQECRSFSMLHACDSCKRILVFDPDAPPPPKAEPTEAEPTA